MTDSERDKESEDFGPPNLIEQRLTQRKDEQIRQKLIFVLGMMLTLMSLFFLIAPEIFSELFAQGYSDSARQKWATDNISTFRFLGACVLVLSSACAAYLYASGFNPSIFRKQNEKTYDDKEISNEFLADISQSITSIDEKFQKLSPDKTFSEDERKEIVDRLTSTIDDRLSGDFLRLVEEKYGASILNKKTVEFASHLHNKFIARAENSTEKLQKSANVYLFYGFSSAILGLSVLTGVTFFPMPHLICRQFH